MISAENREGHYHIAVEGRKPCTVVLVNTGAPKAVSGAAYVVEGNDLVLQLNGTADICVEF